MFKDIKEIDVKRYRGGQKFVFDKRAHWSFLRDV